MNRKLKPALIGGIAFGLLSSIPFVNFPNACCCAWAIGGGLLAIYLFNRDSAVPITPGDSAITGALTGLIGGIVYFVIGIPLEQAVNTTIAGVLIAGLRNLSPEQAEEMARIAFAQQSSSLLVQILSTVISGIVWVIMFIIFSTLGGLLGSVLFSKKTTAGYTPPSPPSSQWP